MPSEPEEKDPVKKIVKEVLPMIAANFDLCADKFSEIVAEINKINTRLARLEATHETQKTDAVSSSKENT